MNIAIITGSAGLIGSEAVRFFSTKFDLVIGIDNDMRRYFFGEAASTRSMVKENRKHENYKHYDVDIRHYTVLAGLFSKYGKDIRLIVHTAAQPSHDWAATEPITDFEVNALGTLNLLECTRHFCPEAVFIFTSTNKVYGDKPNRLPLQEQYMRYDLPTSHPYYNGIDEQFGIDHTKHSIFGCSKVAADLLVQEYARYFGMKTGIFRGGCLTGKAHAGAQLHGFLSYLVKCCKEGIPYTIIGYGGKQVRDNIHAYDVVQMFWQFYQSPRAGEVYNIGGSRHSNCSVLEAIVEIQTMCGKHLQFVTVPEARIGDHQWYISDVSRFQTHYPQWQYTYTLQDIITELVS